MVYSANAGSPHQEASAPAEQADHATSGIDLERLTERVYRLLQAEVRLGRARGESAPSGPRRRS
jgi:hypothetical protein